MAVPAGCGATWFAVTATAVVRADGADEEVPTAITKSIAACACAWSTVSLSLRAQTVTRPLGFAADGVQVNVSEVVQSPMAFQPSS
jgi:hypothetical protein